MSSPKRQKKSPPDPQRGARLVYARRLTGKRQQEIADALSVSRQTVIGWEKGLEIEEWRMDGVSAAYAASKGWIRYNEGPGPDDGLVAVEPPRLTRPDEEGEAEARATSRKRRR